MDPDLKQNIQDELDGCDYQTRLELLAIFKKQELAFRLNDIEHDDRMKDGKSLFKEYKEMYDGAWLDDNDDFTIAPMFWISKTYLGELYENKVLLDKWG